MELSSGKRYACLGLCTAILCSFAQAAAVGQPLNLADPTPRSIQVEFEISYPPLSIGDTYSAFFDATYSATGNIGTIVISGAEYETAILTRDLDYLDGILSWSLIGGSASDFTLNIDLTTLEATALPLDYQVSIMAPLPQFPQVGTVTRNLSTTIVAGFSGIPEYPAFPFFCDTCILVPASTYDPITGKINAVGSDGIVAADINLLSYSRAGDLRLSEKGAALPTSSTYSLAGLAILLLGLALSRLRQCV